MGPGNRLHLHRVEPIEAMHESPTHVTAPHFPAGRRRQGAFTRAAALVRRMIGAVVTLVGCRGQVGVAVDASAPVPRANSIALGEKYV